MSKIERIARLACIADEAEILTLHSAHRDTLGFLPYLGFRTAIGAGKILVAPRTMRPDCAITGYLLFGPEWNGAVQIHHLVVSPLFRRMGYATALVKALRSLTTAPIIAKVRGDLPANLFWLAAGFTLSSRVVHPTSQRLANWYSLPASEPPFVEIVQGDW
jgi:GNAT superfamily N-acetyltransferase